MTIIAVSVDAFDNSCYACVISISYFLLVTAIVYILVIYSIIVLCV